MDLEEFLDVTPRYFAALQKQEQEKREHDQEMTEIMGAQIVAMVRRCGFIQFKEPMEAKDFRPSEWRKHREKPPVQERRRSRQAIADEYRDAMATVAKRAEL
jgi:hypothetical protein